MPTLQQLPQALAVNDTDEVLLQQGDHTRAITVANLMARAQSRLTLAPNALLGRASGLPGGPESVVVGTGLAMQAGTLTASPVTVSGDLTGGGAGSINVALPAIMAGGTFSKVTVNAKGQVVNGDHINAADVTAALGYSPYSTTNPAGYVTSAVLSAIAPLNSPALTGAPTAPTPALSDSSNAIATTGFVQSRSLPLTVTGDVVGSGTGTIALTLPAITAGGLFSKVTVNAKGQVTAGGSLAAADVTAALGFVPYNAANPAGYTTAAGVSVFPALAYGAHFDGVQDDQPGIAAAIAAAHGAGGGVVLLPAARGTLANTIVQPYSHVQLVGAGSGQAYESSTNTYVSATVLTWTGAVGGTMLSVGPAQNTVSGKAINNADVRGIMFDAANKAGIAIMVASTNKSRLDLCYANPLQCGVRFSTVWLKAQTSAADTYEINDCQHNEVSIQGLCVNATASTVAVAVPVGGATTVSLASAAGFLPGMQVRIGAGLYTLTAVAGNTITLAVTVTQSDGVAGSAVAFAPRGVWLHGLTIDTIPSGIHSTFLSATYPLAWNGNISLNQFRSVVLIHYTAGDGFVFGYSDHNLVDKLTVYSNPGANGLVFDGSNIAGGGSAQNRVDYCQVTKSTARGTASYASASIDGYIGYLDTGNASPFPVVETGATVHVRTDTDLHYNARLLGPVIYDAAWEPVTGTYVPVNSTSLTVVNNSNDHIRLATGLNTAVWSLTVDPTVRNLAITPVAGGGSVTVNAPMAVSGALTAPTPAAADNSTSAATTAWVRGRGYVQQVATVAALRAYAMAGLSSGTAMLVDTYATPADNGGGLFVWNSASAAIDNAGTVINPSGNAGAGRWVRLLNGQRVTPQMFGAVGDGVSDDSPAFNAALASGPVYVPPAIYVVANVTVPNGALIEGDVGLGYTGDIASGTPTASQQLTPVRPILLAKPGTTTRILNVSGSMDVVIKGVFLDGGVNTATCDGVSAGSTRLTMERCTVVRCVNGIGSQSGTTLYTSNATIIDSEFANNVNGVANLINSVMMAGAVSANATGVNLGSGANSNNFIGVRFESNYQDGLQGSGASGNQVIGGLFDRNAWRGVNLGGGCSDWTFTGVQFARNGSSNVYPNNSHVALNGTTSIFFMGCISRSGKNDDGTGTLSPAYFVNFLNTNASVTISGCDVSGYVSGFSFGSNPTSYVQRDNNGGGDTVVTASRPYIGAGVAAQTLVTKTAVNIAPGQSTTISIGQSPSISNYSVTGRELVVTATNLNAPYQYCAARFNLAFYRDTAVHAPAASAAYGEAGGAGVVTWGGAGKLQLSALAVAADGSSWTLNILNGGTGDGSNWSVWAELR